MYESKPYYYGTGRRKHSVARVRVYPGSGVITVNGRGIDDYFGLETLKLTFVSLSLLQEQQRSLTLSAQLQAAVLQVRQALSATAFQEHYFSTATSFVPYSRRQAS